MSKTKYFKKKTTTPFREILNSVEELPKSKLARSEMPTFSVRLPRSVQKNIKETAKMNNFKSIDQFMETLFAKVHA